MSLPVNKGTNGAGRNAVLAHAGRYLDTLGSWSTYQGVSSLEELAGRVARVTYTFTGLGGLLEGRPHLAGLLGAIIAVHLLEQVTSGLATAAGGLAVRGEPLARYRGLLIRRSPVVRLTRLLSRLPGLPLSAAGGYYFVEAGRTWQCEVITLELAQSSRTLSRLHSLSLPHREYLFDRPVTIPGLRDPQPGELSLSIQSIIDLVKGDRTPESIPGFIGSINELESLVMPLRGAKRFLFMANWLLIDPAERDDGSGDVNYGRLANGTPPGNLSGGGRGTVYRPLAPQTGPGSSWPSTSRSAGQPTRPAATSVPVQTTGSTPKPVPIRPLNAPRQIPMNLTRPAPSVNSHQPPPPPPLFYPDENPSEA